MKAKKILSAVLTLGVIATCGFVGCGEGEQTAQAQTSRPWNSTMVRLCKQAEPTD